MREYVDLLAQKGVGTLEFFVAQQQALNSLNNSFGDGVDLVGVGHNDFHCRVWRVLPRRICRVGARSVVHTLQFNGKQERVFATLPGPARKCERHNF